MGVCWADECLSEAKFKCSGCKTAWYWQVIFPHHNFRASHHNFELAIDLSVNMPHGRHTRKNARPIECYTIWSRRKRKLPKGPSRNLVQLIAQDATLSTQKIMNLIKSALIVVTQLARVALAITREVGRRIYFLPTANVTRRILLLPQFELWSFIL
jgi:hypothetical protein